MASFIWRSVITFFSPKYYNFLMELGLACGQHLVCYCGETSRKYTPTETRVGSFDLIVKVYPDGVLGNHMNKLNIGDDLVVAGRPVGKNLYLGNGEFTVSNRQITTRSIVFICAGSGITPIYAILQKMIEHNDTGIDTKVLYVNKTYDDIILRDKLNVMNNENDNISVRFSLTRPDADWPGLKGRPTKEMIQDIFTKEKEQVVVICGSRDFNSDISQLCLDLGVAKDNMIIY